MLDHLFPAADWFRLCRNEHRSLGITLTELLRRQKLFRAFATRRELRRTLQTGEIWTIQSDQTFAANSFIDLLRHIGHNIPVRFEGASITLPRHDHGLVLTYDAAQSRPWDLEYRVEASHVRLRGMSFTAVIRRALDLDCERAHETAQKFSALSAAIPSLPLH